MIVRNLYLEHHCDSEPHSLTAVLAAINKMRSPDGPTFVVLFDANRNYAQAAGSNNRYCVESRDVFGEGFIHWRASRTAAASGSTATVEYRTRRPKPCTLTVPVGEVLTFEQMSLALMYFASRGTRTSEFTWRDVTAEFLNEGKQTPIRDITAGRVIAEAERGGA